MANMNRCCRDANNYLEKTDVTNFDELRMFVDNFNVKIENYSTNGLSSFLLGCVELCLKLSQTISYGDGEVRTRWLKGNILSLGGQYKNALRSYKCALNRLNINDEMYGVVIEDYALNLVYTGDFQGVINLIEDLKNRGRNGSVNYILSNVLNYRAEYKNSIALLNKSSKTGNYYTLQKINSLTSLNELEESWNLISNLSTTLSSDDLFLVGYCASIAALITVKKNECFDIHNIPFILNKLNSHKSFYHYIDGLLNIAEIYLIVGEIEKSSFLLDKALRRKKELKTLDIRLFKLLETLSTKKEDNKLACEYKSKVLVLLEDIDCKMPSYIFS